jgi:transcriptional regulator with XRE-family HTH domain
MVNSIDKHVGGRVAARRAELNVSLAAAAAQLQVASHVLLDQEAGRRRIGAEQLLRLSQLLDVPADFFYEGLHDYLKRSRRSD